MVQADLKASILDAGAGGRLLGLGNTLLLGLTMEFGG